MFQLLSDISYYLAKPVINAVLRKKSYPEDAISRKDGIIAEVGFSKKDKVIMFHGVSVGEVVALENLINTVRKEFPDHKIVVTTGTHTGQDIAKKKFGEVADLITYFPSDFPVVIKRFLDKVKPEIVFIAETEMTM